MALQKKPTEDVKKEVDETSTPEVSAADKQKQKIVEAQDRINKDKENGATAGEAAKDPEPEKKVEEDIPKGTNEVATKPAAGAVGKPNGRVDLILQDRKDVMVAAYGTFPRIKTGSGNFTDGEIDYGTWFVFEMLSFNELFSISPNSDSKDKAVQEEEKQAIKYSYDGINLEDGTGTVADYLAKLKKDWPSCEPSAKNYRELVGLLVDCDNAAQAEDNMGQMVQIQLAPTSRAKHDGYLMASSFHVQRNVFSEDEAAVMMIKAKAASGGGFNWTKMIFSKYTPE